MNFKLHRDTMNDLLDFMKAVRGSFYNAAYISCNRCPNKDKCNTQDFIFAPAYQGKPVLIKRLDVISLVHDIEPEQYSFIIDSQKFMDFYDFYISWSFFSDKECPLPQLALNIEREVVSKSGKNPPEICDLA